MHTEAVDCPQQGAYRRSELFSELIAPAMYLADPADPVWHALPVNDNRNGRMHCFQLGFACAGSVHLYFHPEWPDIKLAQAAILCKQAADMIQSEGLNIEDVPVVFGGDWNSLWRKYTPDLYDDKVRLPTILLTPISF